MDSRRIQGTCRCQRDGRGGNPQTTSCGGRHGFSMIELLLAISVLLVAVLALSRSLGTSMKLTEVNRETALATDGAREILERLQGVEDFRTLFALYNDDPTDDPGGVPGSAPGSGFAVSGLSPVAGDPDGLVGELVFPTLVGPNGLELHEDIADASLGMPRDLTGNGGIDGANHEGDYMLLPVAARMRWAGSSGERTLEVRTLIADR